MNDVKETFMVVSDKQTFEKIQEYYLKKGCKWTGGQSKIFNLNVILNAKYIRCSRYNMLTYGFNLDNIILIDHKQIYLKSNILDIE